MQNENTIGWLQMANKCTFFEEIYYDKTKTNQNVNRYTIQLSRVVYIQCNDAANFGRNLNSMGVHHFQKGIENYTLCAETIKCETKKAHSQNEWAKAKRKKKEKRKRNEKERAKRKEKSTLTYTGRLLFVKLVMCK